MTNEIIILVGLYAPQNYHIDENEIDANSLIWWDDKKKKSNFDLNFDISKATENSNEEENNFIDENQVNPSNLQKEQETF